MNLITTDYYGNKYEADPKNMSVSIHVYGIAIKDNQALICRSLTVMTGRVGR